MRSTTALLIEAIPRDAAALLEMLDVTEGTGPPIRHATERAGTLVPGPEGTTVRFQGATQFRGVDIAPVLEFVIEVGATVSGTVIATWIIRKFKGKVQRLTINRREINFDDEGKVSRIVEEEIRRP